MQSWVVASLEFFLALTDADQWIGKIKKLLAAVSLPTGMTVVGQQSADVHSTPAPATNPMGDLGLSHFPHP